MKIWGVVKEENLGKEYKDEDGNIWEVVKRGNYLEMIDIATKESMGDLYLLGAIFGMDFKKVNKPVSFQDVLNSDKKCKVEHELIDRCIKNMSVCYTYGVDYLETAISDIKTDNYMYLDSLMSGLGLALSNQRLKEVINDGKWYLEEE